MRSALFAVLGVVALMLGLSPAPSASASDTGYTYFEIGDVSAPTPGSTEPGLMLMGGGEWSYDAWRWFLSQAGNGHIVILRASGDAEAGEEIYRQIGGAASVQTVIFDDRKAAEDPRILAMLDHADGIFLAGGDQANYVRFWKGTSVQKAINDHVARGRPIGGTSAGLAILGAVGYGAMDGGSVDAITALRDPTGPAVTLVGDFLDMPYLDHVVTDTHFTARSRLGRLIAFVAQVRAGGDPQAIGIGVDEDGALCVDKDGVGRFYTASRGYAWLVQPEGVPTLTSGKPLDYPVVRITTLGTEGRIDLKTMRISQPVFSGTASVVAGRLEGVPVDPHAPWSLAIHGGAGVIERGALTPEAEAGYRQGLQAALDAGAAVLSNGGTSLDAVEATVRVLEDNPLFNAGKGAVFNADGVNNLDASIMDGASRNAGAVTGVTRTRNPVSLARVAMERSGRLLLSGPGADAFSRLQGLEQVEPSYFFTQERWNQYLAWKAGQQQAAIDPTHRYGTVGAVALDKQGHLAAATSTGGLTGKQWGRIGDSPIIGAGTYAADGVCAVSATGTGEYFIRTSAARQVCDRVDWNDQTIQEAADDTISDIGEIGGDGGLIAMDGDGKVAFAMNSEGMYRGSVSSSAPAQVAIYDDEGQPRP
ncbi:peptidase T [Brevundimonas sp. Leaf363]|nr:peptidase T [Brevundimonas sp. Leaf363]